MCGKLKLLQKSINLSNFDGIIDIAPGPTGDTELWEARQWYRDKAVMGGIECNTFTRETPEQCYYRTCEIITNIKNLNLNGVLIGSGDSVPFGATIEHFKSIRKAIDENSYK